MSEVMPRDNLLELWQEILKRQLFYLETEESPQKLEERKKLEGCLKEFLCRVRHDRKFFLPETALVLKNSICELKEFSVHKAMNAFESISQYANNLYSKPWRKEFRILKMYSGFYQHEIKSNLVDAEKLFLAMGYRSLSDDTLILDDPICPDQVSNVLRDAMTAYVELQIMKTIHMEMDTNEMPLSWFDIFCYREKHIGGISQAVKDLVYAIEERRYRNREKTLPADNYGYIDVQQPSPSYPTASPQCQCNVKYHQPLPRQRIAASNGPCCMHELPQRNHTNIMFGNYPAAHNYHHQANMGGGPDSVSHLPHMSHSRSLEHYSEPSHVQQHNMLPHRYSFDHPQQGCAAAVHHQHHMPQQRLHHALQQQQYYRNASQNYYDPTYDCIDENSLGGSSISYAAVAAASVAAGGVDDATDGTSKVNYSINSSTYANPYNVSGNRYPLPHNISNQLSAYDNNPHRSLEPNYAHIMDNQVYSQVSKVPQNYMMSGAGGANMYSQARAPLSAMENCNNDAGHRQNLYHSDQLIDFEDPPIIPPPPAAQFDPYHQQYPPHDIMKTKRYNITRPEAVETNIPGHYAPSRDHNTMGNKNNTGDDTYVYAKPIPKECRQANKNTPNSLDKSYLRKVSYASGERTGDTTDLSYESANDDFNNLPRQHQHSPTQYTKNQDGVGSFESWNYVFRNLERSGYTKDLGEREDLLVKSLDLDSLNIVNDSTTPSQSSSAEKRRSALKEIDNPSQVKHKTRVFEASEKMNVNTPAPPSTNTNSNRKQKPQLDNNKPNMKSALKHTVDSSAKANTTYTNKKNSHMAKAIDNKPKASNYNDNNNSRFMGNGKANNKKSSSTNTQQSLQVRKQSEGNSAGMMINTPTSTQIIVTGANEWSCRFCTFINPDTKRICEMCSRTKDYNLDASSASSSNATTTTAAAATQSSVAHNTPTCV